MVRIPSPHSVSVLEVGDLVDDSDAEPDRLRWALSAPVADRARVDLERRLARLDLKA
ncbi:MAG: hypothetical protein HKN80_12970 [Acidimicrobiia bacterium]|nr:hypothetical protein [Acidimicrobiia bacterium]